MSSKMGQRLLPSLVDDIARSDPSRILYSVARTKDPAEGFDDIRALDFAQAVNRCAWFIEKTLGRGQGFPTLVYIGPQDLNYAVLVLASIKTGFKLLLTSPRNTLEAHLNLLDATNCQSLLAPVNFPLPVIAQILNARPMRRVEVPASHQWFRDTGVTEEPYPYVKTFAEASADPFVLLHTSGSTGMPKPITQTHGTISALDAFANAGEQRPTYPAMCRGKRVYVAFPLFHCAGIHMLLPGSLFGGFTVVLGPFPPSTEVVNSVHLHGNVQHSCLAATTLVDLVKDPTHLENLNRLELVTFGGGPCPEAVGNLVSTKTRLLNCLGTTECGVLPAMLSSEPQDWPYLRLDQRLGYEYRHFSGDFYEQVIVRDQSRYPFQGIFATFPELTEWHMKDLYTKHPDPEKSDHWLYQGRSDDIIVFSTGEKLNPIDMESIICANPVVSGALVAGLGRFQSSLLVEAVKPPSSIDEKEHVLELIWPSVQAANKKSPSHGVIHRNMIAFTSAAKPMLRAGKGSVQRKMTLDAYASEIDSLYKAGEAPASQSTQRSGERIDDIGTAIKNIISANTNIDGHAVPADADLFELGLDSLQVTTIARDLTALLSFHAIPQSMEAKTVYSHPSVAGLIDVVLSIIHGRNPEVQTHQMKLEELYRRYAANMPISARRALPKAHQSPSIVLMTGSTGSLGSYVLDSLQNDDQVERIYCLCRGPNSFERQQSTQASNGLRPLSDKVHCFDTELSKSYFGLETDVYRELLNQVTHVIHNAWQVDFNLSINSFEKHISTVRQFIDFSSHSLFGAKVFFVSSISAVSGLRGSVAEQVYTDWDTPEANGYGQSKFLSERLLDEAAREADIAGTIYRIGQVAGPTTSVGVWPTKEWLPSLIASSKYLNKIPSSLGRLNTVDWIPVDIVGKSVVELAIHARDSHDTHDSKLKAPGATVYHGVNPNQITWDQVASIIIRSLSKDQTIESVPLEVWISALRESASRSEDVALNPATKLLTFFENLVSKDHAFLSTDNTLSISQTLSTVGPVRDEWVDNWMRQWAF